MDAFDGLGDGFVLPMLGLVGMAALITYALFCLVRMRRPRPAVTAARVFASLCGAAAIGIYGWYLAHLAIGEAWPDRLCKAAVGEDRFGSVIKGEIGHLPLSFGCRMSDGSVVPTDLDWWVNPLVGTLVAVALALAFVGRGRRRPVGRRVATAPARA